MSKHLLLTVALTGLVTALAAQSPPPPPSPTITAQIKQDVSRVENAQPQSTNSPSQISPTAINHTTAKPTQKSTNSNREASQRATPFNWSRLNTVLLTLFNGILAIVAVYQYRLTRRQTDLTERSLVAAKDAAEAAKKSADAATDAVAHAKNTTTVTERALVVLENVRASTNDYIGDETVIIFMLRNFGKNPTLVSS